MLASNENIIVSLGDLLSQAVGKVECPFQDV